MKKEQEKALKQIKKELKELGDAMVRNGILATNISIDEFKTAFISVETPAKYCDKCGGVKGN